MQQLRRPQSLAISKSGRLSSREVALFGLLASLALIFGYLEVLFPLPVPVPGVKLGLGNIVVLFALLGFGVKPAFVVMIIKVMVSSLLFGNPAVFIYSFAGGVLSFLVMWAACYIPRISCVGVSAAGGIAHILGQLLVVAAVLAPYVALSYAPVLIVTGLLTGTVIGFICRLVIRAVGRSGLFKSRLKAFALQNRIKNTPGVSAQPDTSAFE